MILYDAITYGEIDFVSITYVLSKKSAKMPIGKVFVNLNRKRQNMNDFSRVLTYFDNEGRLISSDEELCGMEGSFLVKLLTYLNKKMELRKYVTRV